MKWFDKEGFFDITKVDNIEQLQEICVRVNDRANKIWDDDREIFFNDTYVTIKYSWEDYCRGCHMGTETEYVEIPNEIFFSNYSLSQWQQEEAEKKKIDEEKAAKKKAAADKKQKKAEAKEAAIRKEQKDIDDYERLKQKYEGET